MHCLNCGARIAITGEAYCDTGCALAARTNRRPEAALPERHRDTLRALLDGRAVSREEAAGFFGWITRPVAAWPERPHHGDHLRTHRHAAEERVQKRRAVDPHAFRRQCGLDLLHELRRRDGVGFEPRPGPVAVSEQGLHRSPRDGVAFAEA